MGETVNRVALGIATLGNSELVRGIAAAGEAGIKKVDELSGAKAARDEQARKAQELIDIQNAEIEAANLKKTQDADASAKAAANNAAVRSARTQKQKKAGMGGSGRAGTILTSPLGQTGGGASAPGRKTILGG